MSVEAEEYQGALHAMHDVNIRQQNPDSILHSASTFEDLNLSEELKKGVYMCGYARPSKIQAHALPLLLRDPPEHLIAQAQTGTGKTAAFSLAILSRLDFSDPSSQAIVLAPSRELARQIYEVMKKLAKYTSATITQVVPQCLRPNEQIQGQVLIGTPGKVSDMLKRTICSGDRRTYIDKSRVKMLVLDEADYLLDCQGLGDQSLKLKLLLPRNIQLVFFSATWDDAVLRFAESFIGGPANKIRLETYQLTLEYVKQFFIDCDSEEDRFRVLRRDVAERVSKRMVDHGHQVSFLHGHLTPNERDEVMGAFRSGRTKVLVTTNVLARGIDVERVNMIINYDLPMNKENKADPTTYLHRIGRTGRFGRLGVSVNFVHDHSSQEALEEFQSHFRHQILKVPIDLDVADGTVIEDQDGARLERMELFFKKAMKE
ncbi:RNA helicase required for poly(A+) mRNA export [Dissophora ornata]|nr:RNA helicase required for poly(A+) mRNA export [Dissophora ornata]